MAKLLTDVLTLARAEAGKLECNLEPIEMQSFCLNLLEDIQLSQDKPHPIRLIKDGPCTHANVDEHLIYSILSNLLSNAIKYSPKQKEIIFRLSCYPEKLIFQIQDQGIGIPWENQTNLYQPFYRGQNVAHIVGTGLGLAVVKKCLELHHGHIRVNSHEGIGTTFTINIPLTKFPNSTHHKM
jgi:signal transduction histidine kinase